MTAMQPQRRQSPTILTAVAAVAVMLMVGGAWLYDLVTPTDVLRDDEASLLVELLGVRPGLTLAEIGAGNGWLTVRIAEQLVPEGRMFSTELRASRLERIRGAVTTAGLENVTIIEAAERETKLPSGCCEAVFMRTVYHHFSDPRSIAKSIHEALKPGGLLAVIDYEPGQLWTFLHHRGHTVHPQQVIDEVTAVGFEMVRIVEDWPSDEQLYAVLFGRN